MPGTDDTLTEIPALLQRGEKILYGVRAVWPVHYLSSLIPLRGAKGSSVYQPLQSRQYSLTVFLGDVTFVDPARAGGAL